MSDEILGESITLKDTKGHRRFEVNWIVDVPECVEAFLKEPIRHGVTIKMSKWLAENWVDECGQRKITLYP